MKTAPCDENAEIYDVLQSLSQLLQKTFKFAKLEIEGKWEEIKDFK